MNQSNTISASKIAEYVASGAWDQVEECFNQSINLRHLGVSVKLDDLENPWCGIEDIQSLHLGGIGQEFVNGAVISAIIDLAIGLTGLKYAQWGSFATANLNIDFAQPVKKGRFYAVSTCNKQIGKKLYSEATVFDSDDRPCVYASGSLRTAIKAF